MDGMPNFQPPSKPMTTLESQQITAAILVSTIVYNAVKNYVDGIIDETQASRILGGLENIVCRLAGSRESCITKTFTELAEHFSNGKLGKIENEDVEDTGEEEIKVVEGDPDEERMEKELIKTDREVEEPEVVGTDPIPQSETEVTTGLQQPEENPSTRGLFVKAWYYSGGLVVSGVRKTSGWVWDGTTWVWDETGGRLFKKKVEEETVTDPEDTSVEELIEKTEELSVGETRKSPGFIKRMLTRTTPSLEALRTGLSNEIVRLSSLEQGWRFNRGVSALISQIANGNWDPVLNDETNPPSTIEGEIPQYVAQILRLAADRDQINLAVATINHLRELLANRTVIVETDEIISDSKEIVTIDESFDTEAFREFIKGIESGNLTQVWRYIIHGGDINYNIGSLENPPALAVALTNYLTLEDNEKNAQARANLLRIIKILLSQGALPNQATIPDIIGIPQLNPYLDYQRENFFEAWLNPEQRVAPQFEGAILLSAVKNGNLSAIQYILPLLAEGAINYQNSAGRTALSIAAELGNGPAVTILLGIPGVEVNLPDNASHTPLDYAIMHGRGDIVTMLLRMEGDPNITDENKNSSVMHATLRDIELRRQRDELDDRLRTCKDRTKRRNITIQIKELNRDIENNLRVLEMLLDTNGIEVDIPNSEKNTPLGVAAIHGSFEFLLRLSYYGRANLDVEVDGQPLIEALNQLIEDARTEAQKAKVAKDKEEEKRQNRIAKRLSNVLGRINSEIDRRGFKMAAKETSINPIRWIRGGESTTTEEKYSELDELGTD